MLNKHQYWNQNGPSFGVSRAIWRTLNHLNLGSKRYHSATAFQERFGIDFALSSVTNMVSKTIKHLLKIGVFIRYPFMHDFEANCLGFRSLPDI